MKLMNGWKKMLPMIAVVTLVSAIPVGAGGPVVMIPASQARNMSSPEVAKPDLSGKWDMYFVSENGPVEAKGDFKVDGDGKITGTIVSVQYGTSTIDSGSVTDVNFTIRFNINPDGSGLEVNMSGTFDEKSLKGTGSAGDTSFSFTGTRSSSSQNQD
jgi:hypothetical protein